MKQLILMAPLLLGGLGCASSQFPYSDASSTHIIASETPYYAASPAQGRPADGTLRLGMEVTLLANEGSYSRVKTNDEGGKPIEVYIATDALLALGRH